MSYQVVDLLRAGRSAPKDVSALDAVMGENWAIVEAGRARRHRDVGLGLKLAHRRNLERMGGGGLPGRKPQAVIKMVRKGGASDVRGLRAQLAYLSRDGAQPVQRSEDFGGIDVDAEQAADIERSWRMPPEGSGRADRTSHFIASFPEITHHDAAERAGRAWAEEMFGSGNYGGDSYDYYTAFHTDRSHPHMHVVVHRRGLDRGEWLKVSQRSDMNYDTMRAVLVDVAAHEGIELEATPRLARAVHDRPVPDAEYRLAGREGRQPVPPEHTRETAILAAAALIHQSRRFATEAQLVEHTAPEAAQVLYAASRAASEGGSLAIVFKNISTGQETGMSQRIEEAKTEIRSNIAAMDRGMDEVGDSATRMRLARDIAELKAETAPLLGNARDLTPFTEPGTSGRYVGLDANRPSEMAARRWVEDEVRLVAARYGVDPDATVERYAGPAPSKGLEAHFERAEVEERSKSRIVRGEEPENALSREVALSKMHRDIGTIYGTARTRGREADREADRPEREAAATNTDAAAETRRQQEQSQATRTAAPADPIAERIAAERAAEAKAATEREQAKRQQEREDAERAKRERDNGRGL